jgi:transcriptional regulator GlxA family with amidase domain
MVQRKPVGILLFDDVEVLDFAGPFEVLSVTRLDEGRRREEPSPFQVFTLGGTGGPVRAFGGLTVVPDLTIDTCPRLDVLLVPGGWGTRREVHNDRLIKWIKRVSQEVELVTSVCTGSALLGKAGILDGRNATTHWLALDWLREVAPKARVLSDQHVVKDGNVFTSAGISAGIDMALLIVAHFLGDEIARSTARYMEYGYPTSNKRRV